MFWVCTCVNDGPNYIAIGTFRYTKACSCTSSNLIGVNPPLASPLAISCVCPWYIPARVLTIFSGQALPHIALQSSSRNVTAY